MSDTAIVSVIDDDESVRVALDGLLRSHGYSVRTYASAIDFLSSAELENTACLLSDIQMPGMTGVQLLDELRARGVDIPLIFITGLPAVPPRARPGAGGSVAVFAKPFRCAELVACIESILGRQA
ncbi:response regulator [Pseudomonas sp. SWRI154]|uniref:response regulator transcription factor n=1 Tax=Pseudomonas sp. SWRI154 TaxID=2745501 RepID=UPI00164715F9|nr:response regulator [Pseudomonas sp. SWRI154]MBC3362845.1 response regulator [Pseudomonas sp. SWRI154]